MSFLAKSHEGGSVDEEVEVHGGADRLCPAPSGERDPGGGDHPQTAPARRSQEGVMPGCRVLENVRGKKALNPISSL